MNMLDFEREIYGAGKSIIAGIDEAGRGSLAGPVVAGAVILPKIEDLNSHPPFYSQIDDSKKLTPKKREELYRLMMEDDSIHIGIGIIDEKTIDAVNILNATFRAMKKALSNLPVEPETILVDGSEIPGLNNSQTAIIDGDALSLSIAAASIVAKVVRDSIMVKYDAVFPQYGFKQHKGYGTRLHVENLSKHGPCVIHRRSFAPVRQFALD